jgi:hypothetical protein
VLHTLGADPPAEPSLMMPVIIISFSLNEPDGLDFRTGPLQG